MGKTTAVYVNFLCDVACQKLLKSANVSRSYSKNNTGTVFFLRHGVVCVMWHYTEAWPRKKIGSLSQNASSPDFPQLFRFGIKHFCGLGVRPASLLSIQDNASRRSDLLRASEAKSFNNYSYGYIVQPWTEYMIFMFTIVVHKNVINYLRHIDTSHQTDTPRRSACVPVHPDGLYLIFIKSR